MSGSNRMVLVLICFFGVLGTCVAQNVKKSAETPVLSPKKRWTDSVYNALSPEERIGQLFMVAAYSGGKNYNEEQITQLLRNRQIGGLIFMQGGPVRQALLTNKYQKEARVPLLISMDAEWGLGMRLDSVKNFPRQMMLGATQDEDLVYKMGECVAKQCKRLGVHIDFAPDIDVNNNPENPVINTRSFGEDKTWVAKLGVAYMKGLQNNGVIACGKHFPGHGDTNVDSHKDLPLVTKSMVQLDTLELYPFKALIQAGIKSIMVAHLEVPALDTTPHLPTSLSKNTVTKLLKHDLGFSGLIFTDALGMQGVTKYYPNGDADLLAFEAGNDVLLFSQDVPIAISKINSALDSGKILPERLENSVKKILNAKYDAGLSRFKEIDTTYLVDNLNRYVETIKYQAAKEGISLIRDKNDILSKLNEKSNIGYVGLNVTSNSSEMLDQIITSVNPINTYWLPKKSNREQADSILNSISNFDAVIVGVHNINFSPLNNYGLNDDALYFLKQVEQKKNVMVVYLGNAYAMQTCLNVPSVMVCYEDDSIIERVSADILLKKLKARGKLSVTPTAANTKPAIVQKAAEPKGVPTNLLRRCSPAEAGVADTNILRKADELIEKCIADGVFPGCRVLAARNSKIFYDKSFGYLQYDKQIPVDSNTLYDLASCTKILATTFCVMRLYEEGKLDLDKTVGDYLPASRGTNKEQLKIKDLLLHQAGLRSFIPFYKETLEENGKLAKEYYRKKRKSEFEIPVAKNLFIRNDYPDTIWSTIYRSPLDNLGKSVYSDLDYYFLWAIVEQITGKSIADYANEQFYAPLGLTRTLYKPLDRFDTSQIAPTEWDAEFRHELVNGYVHDPGAAMLGGIAGHAGLFSTAGEVAVLFQLLLNKGTYAGKRYFKATTIELFTGYHSRLNHRGYGFDKPSTDENDGGPAGSRCSAATFGHTGFTGTCVWADPATGVLFVFLSNRVYPSATNTKIQKMNVRTTLQDFMYESFGLPVVHDRRQTYDRAINEGR
jgi:beta-N-acetylhexosaminidase